jgi:hypothetical protein
MKQIRNVEALPKWFDLASYQKFHKLKKQTLLLEIETRTEFLEILQGKSQQYEIDKSELNNQLNKGPFFFSEHPDRLFNYKRDVDSEIDDATYFRSRMILNENANILPNLDSGGVALVNTQTVINYYKEIEAFFDEYQDELSQKEIDYISSIASADGMVRSNSIDEEDSGKFIFQIDIRDSTDAELIRRFKTMLFMMRDMTNIPEVQRTPPKRLELDKVKNYKLIEISDLKIWELLTGNKITNKVLAFALWPDGRIGSDNIKQTIMPLFNRMFTADYWKRR